VTVILDACVKKDLLDEVLVQARRMMEAIQPYLIVKDDGRFAVLVDQDGNCLDVADDGKLYTLSERIELANGWACYVSN